jgi:hypothetical protein
MAPLEASRCGEAQIVITGNYVLYGARLLHRHSCLQSLRIPILQQNNRLERIYFSLGRFQPDRGLNETTGDRGMRRLATVG